MTDYTTFTFSRKTHYNEYSPDIKMECTLHQEDNLDRVIELMGSFLIACGYSDKAIKETMAEYAVDE